MYFVMSDIHGCHDQMMAALSHWGPETETLIVLGDLIDRGPDSLKVIQALSALKRIHKDRVVILKGNHDESFASWLLDTPEEDLAYYYMTSHDETIRSFYGHTPEQAKKCKRDTRKQRGQHIRYHFFEELKFLDRLPMVHETEHCIFVHAGINLNIPDWRDDTRCMNEIRNPFIYSSKKAPKRVFFGHTPTALIRDDETDCSVWISEQGDKVGLDGGCSMGGQLNTLRVNEIGDITETIVIHQKEVSSNGC